MINDLKIKAADDSEFKDGYTYYHVKMGSGFIDALECPLQLKEPIENDARKEHGVRMLVSTKISKRSVTLRFNIHGSSKEVFMQNKKRFEQMLYKGMVDIKIDDINHPDVYHLVYTGKSVAYQHSYNGTFGIISCQFTEPNPANRTSEANTYVRTI